MHFDQINVIYVCLAVMIALSLPGNIKEVTTDKQASNNENTLDVRPKEYKINTSEGLIPDAIVDREEKVVAKDLKANDNSIILYLMEILMKEHKIHLSIGFMRHLNQSRTQTKSKNRSLYLQTQKMSLHVEIVQSVVS